jgi:hypothetical protein
VVTVRRWWHSRFGGSLVRELVLVVALLLAYKYGRFLASGHVRAALDNARYVIDLERALGVFSEAQLQGLVLDNAGLVKFLNVYYLLAHTVVTAAAFVWLFALRPQGYRRFRNVMVVITLAGMIVHLAMPLAPPRMFPNLGFVDTARVFGPDSYGAGSPYKGFANQFAAMPSLHFGWAVVIAWAVIVAAGIHSRWRYFVLLHPVVTLAAIVLTANHYWLDAVVAVFLFALALVVDSGIERCSPRHRARTARRAARGSPATSGSPSCPERVGQVAATELSDARRPSGMTVDSCVPGVTDT